MIYDRPYMRRDFRSGSHDARPWFWWTLWLITGCYVLQLVLLQWFGASYLLNYFILSDYGLLRFRIWTLLSYALLHASITHILLNVLGAYFIGRILVSMLGHLKTTTCFWLCVLVGGIFWSLFYLPLGPAAKSSGFSYPAAVLGASAGLYGILILFCLMQWGRQIQLLLFLVLPVRISTNLVFYLSVGTSLLGFLFFELPALLGRSAMEGGVSHSGHLGGCLGGWLCYLYFQGRLRLPGFLQERVRVEAPAWQKRAESSKGADRRNFRIRMSKKPSEATAEIDHILDKINESGFGSLTEAEKQQLDKAGKQRKR